MQWALCPSCVMAPFAVEGGEKKNTPSITYETGQLLRQIE
jgi:hypothetical protein